MGAGGRKNRDGVALIAMYLFVMMTIVGTFGMADFGVVLGFFRYPKYFSFYW